MREHPEAVQNTQHGARPHCRFIFKMVRDELSQYEVIVDLYICKIRRTMGILVFCLGGQSTSDGVLAYRGHKCTAVTKVVSFQMRAVYGTTF